MMNALHAMDEMMTQFTNMIGADIWTLGKAVGIQPTTGYARGFVAGEPAATMNDDHRGKPLACFRSSANTE